MIEAKVGDIATRSLAGVPMQLIVTEVTETHIVCGPWTFDRATGAEVDEDLDWGPDRTGSYIIGVREAHAESE